MNVQPIRKDQTKRYHGELMSTCGRRKLAGGVWSAASGVQILVTTPGRG